MSTSIPTIVNSTCSVGYNFVKNQSQRLSEKVQNIALETQETIRSTSVTIGFNKKHAFAAVAIGGAVLASAYFSTMALAILFFSSSSHNYDIMAKLMVSTALVVASLSLATLSAAIKGVGGNWKAVAGGVTMGFATAALFSLEIVPVTCITAITAGVIAGSKISDDTITA